MIDETNCFKIKSTLLLTQDLLTETLRQAQDDTEINYSYKAMSN